MNDIFQAWLTSLIAGIGAGFTIAFIAWAVGFAIYGLIKMFKFILNGKEKQWIWKQSRQLWTLHLVV